MMQALMIPVLSAHRTLQPIRKSIQPERNAPKRGVIWDLSHFSHLQWLQRTELSESPCNGLLPQAQSQGRRKESHCCFFFGNLLDGQRLTPGQTPTLVVWNGASWMQKRTPKTRFGWNLYCTQVKGNCFLDLLDLCMYVYMHMHVRIWFDDNSACEGFRSQTINRAAGWKI